MNAHVLKALLPDGRTIEIGTLGRLEAAVRLRNALAREIGDEYTGFEIVEAAPEPVTVIGRAVTREELLPFRKRAR